jgi:cell division septal protein FtsQ
MKSKVYLGIGFMVLVLVAGGWLYSRSSLFRVSEIIVKSEDPEIDKKAQEKLIMILGRSLFSVPMGEIKKSLEEIPRIKDITVTRVWPNTIGLHLELKPSLFKIFRGLEFVSVDYSGEIIEKVIEGEKLVEVKGIWDPVHSKWSVSDAKRKEIVKFLLEQTQDEQSKIRVFDANFIEWNSKKGLLVMWGDTQIEINLGFEHFDESWKRVNLVWDELKKRLVAIEAVDATYQNRVVARKRRELQNSEYRLNLEELVRRGVNSSSPEAR